MTGAQVAAEVADVVEEALQDGRLRCKLDGVHQDRVFAKCRCGNP